MYRDSVAGLEECCTHNEILTMISKQVQELLEIDKAEQDG